MKSAVIKTETASSLATCAFMPQAVPAPIHAHASGRAGERLGPTTWFAGQRSRLALWSPVMLGLGALVYFALTSEPPHAVGWAVLGIAGLVVACAPRLPQSWLLTGVGLVAVGFGLSVVRADMLAAPVLQERTTTLTMTGQVVDAYGHQDGRPRVTIALSGAGDLDPERRPGLVRIALRKTDARPDPGTWIALTGRLTPLPTPVAPGSYDFARAAYFDGIGAYGFAMGPSQRVADSNSTSLAQDVVIWMALGRHEASERIRSALPGSTGAIAAALTVGDRSEISQTDEDALRDSSLAHVLSISGLHMAIVGLSVFGALRLLAALVPPLALRFQVKKWAAAIALVGAGGYLMLSGASVPAQRSFIMIGLMFVAIIIDRSPFTLRIVAISALIVLAIAPESIVDPSFQMSFAAVTALVAAFEAFEAWQVRRGRPIVMRDTWTGRIAYALLVAVIASVVAGLATAPYAAFHFNRVAAYGVAANVMAMPVISLVIMPAAAITLLALPFGLEALPLAVMGWGIDSMLWIAHQTSSWPGASSLIPSAPPWALGAVSLGGLWLALWRGGWRALGAGPIAAGVIAAFLASGPDILIDREAANVAVRDANGHLAVLSGRRARFAAEEWLERDGDSTPLKDSARRGRSGVWLCADNMCEATAGETRIVYVERAGDEQMACEKRPDILVAARAGQPCVGAINISVGETRKNGAYAIRLSPDGPTIETVRDEIGERPWTVWERQ